MNVQCSRGEALQFLRLLPQETDRLQETTCYQQIRLIAADFPESTLITELRLLFEAYLDYILSSSEKDVRGVEKQLTRLEEMLGLKQKLRLIYRPIVERLVEDRSEITHILRELRKALRRPVRPEGRKDKHAPSTPR